MAYNWRVLGHKTQTDFLTKSVAHGKVAHAYVFSGPSNVGKSMVAQDFARILLCQQGLGCGACPQCHQIDSHSNPDFIWLSLSETIKIEQVRNLSYSLSLKPYAARYKVAVIDSADNMTTEAANGLLKLMEEPRAYTVIILLTDNPYKLLPTILSRVQRVSFGLLPDSEVANAVSDKLPQEDLSVVVEFAGGRIGTAISIANDPTEMEKLKALKLQFRKLESGSLGERLILANDLSAGDAHDIKQTVKYWLANYERRLLQKPTKRLAVHIQHLIKTDAYLDTNVNTKLLLANLMVELSQT